MSSLAAADAASAKCRNCDSPLFDTEGKYCSRCGQDTANHPPTFWEFVHEFITHYVALEGKLWRTLVLLFFKPAELTREYRAGRKQRYISPLRLYITASFLFFLMIKIAGWGNVFHVETTTTQGAAKPPRGLSYSVKGDKPIEVMTLEEMKQGITVNGNGDMDCQPGEDVCAWLKKRLDAKYAGKTGKDMKEMVKAGVMADIPYALFLLLPMFALLTKLVYYQRHWYFGEHVVYALHVHAFTFFVLLMKSLLPRYVGDVVAVAAVIYYFIALQRFFGGRWWVTGLRYMTIGLIYPIMLTLVTSSVVMLVFIF